MAAIAPLHSEGQAAEILGVQKNTLAAWRCRKSQPLPYVKVGRLVRYKESDLVKFLERNTIKPVAVQ